MGRGGLVVSWLVGCFNQSEEKKQRQMGSKRQFVASFGIHCPFTGPPVLLSCRSSRDPALGPFSSALGPLFLGPCTHKKRRLQITNNNVHPTRRK